MPGRTPGQDQLLEEASLWFARMRGPEADFHRPDFDRWLARGAAHRGAYNRAGEIFALGKFMAETPDLATIETRNSVDPWLNKKHVALAACLLLLLALGAWFGKDVLSSFTSGRPNMAGQPQGNAPDFDRVSADPKQQRELALADGSRVVLEAGSVLGTRYSATRRELRLERGRVRFDVAHEGRPFIVYAGGGSVTARGTVFDVILDARNEVTVHLVRGAVDVARPNRELPDQNRAQIVARLSPGETLRFAASTLPDTGQAPPFDGLMRKGDLLDFEKAPVAAVIAYANQDSGISIRVADPAIGALQVSGRFRIDDPEQVAERLGTLLNLKAERVGPREILLEKP